MTKKETLEIMYDTFSEKERVSYSEFKKVLDLFNLKASEAISQGETLKTAIGYIQVIRTRRSVKTSTPNWEESNKLRKEIIEKGGTPYNKLKHPEGEEWLIFHTHPFVYKTQWNSVKYIKNSVFYNLKTYKHHRKRIAFHSKTGLLDLI
jgi:hypothetical protein